MYLWKNIALIEDDSHFTKWVKQTGRLDHHTGFLKMLKPYVKGTVLDIGANIGTHTIFYSRLAERVLAFEPNQVAFECLEYNLKDKAELYNVAVSNHIGYIDIVPQGANYGAAYTIPGLTVPTITIDSLNLESCNFIKIDVEGDEVAVLLGARETIQKHRPVMCIESNPGTLQRKGLSVENLVKTILSLGYTTKEPVPTNVGAEVLCIPTN
jgi:FkbM family methyltransferase